MKASSIYSWMSLFTLLVLTFVCIWHNSQTRSVNGKVCSLAKAFRHQMQWIMRQWHLHAIPCHINCNSRQTRIFSLQIASWILNGVCFLAQISKPLNALRARLLLTSSYYEGLQDYACASKDYAVSLWGLVPYFDLWICHI